MRTLAVVILALVIMTAGAGFAAEKAAPSTAAVASLVFYHADW